MTVGRRQLVHNAEGKVRTKRPKIIAAKAASEEASEYENRSHGRLDTICLRRGMAQSIN